MSTRTHPVAPEEVMAFFDGELSPERAAAVSTHLNVCSDCKEISAQLKTTSQSLSKWETDEPKASLLENMMEQATDSQAWVDSKPEWLRHFQLFFSRPLPWALACLMMVVLIGIRFSSFERATGHRSNTSGYDSVLLTNPPPPPDPLATFGDKGAAGGGGEAAVINGDYAHKIPFQAQPGSSQTDAYRLPMIARTLLLSIVVKDFDAGRASLDAILARHNGYAASLSVNTAQGAARTLQASLRIPAPQLAAAIGELKALGRAENETQTGEEVTQQHADLLARLKNSRETEQRLQDVLRTRTGKVKDVLEVEEEIARVRGEIEQMEAEQKTLEHRVEFATIDLKLAEEYKAQLNTPAPSVLMQLRNASINGFRNAFESFLALVLFLVESGPSLLLWLALLGIPAWRLWKRYGRAQSLAPLAGA
ncbi:MAG TPA: DUF4349 domain-containing protein [Candidatus Acidoferrum sp.]